MAVLIPPGFGVLTFVLDLDGDPEEQTTSIAYAAPADPSLEQLLARCEAFSDAFVADLNDKWTYNRLVDRFNDTGTITEAEEIVNLQGQGQGTNLPSNCALLVRKGVAEVGRGREGRMFIPGMLPEASVDHNGDQADALFVQNQGNVAAFESALRIEANTGISDLIVLHDESSPLANDPSVISGLQVQRKIATQRRRMR